MPKCNNNTFLQWTNKIVLSIGKTLISEFLFFSFTEQHQLAPISGERKIFQKIFEGNGTSLGDAHKVCPSCSNCASENCNKSNY
jgi:hypothetical protein